MFRIRLQTILISKAPFWIIRLRTFLPVLLLFITFIVSCNVVVSICFWSKNSKQELCLKKCINLFLFLFWVYTFILFLNKHNYLISKISICFDDNIRKSKKIKKKYYDINQERRVYSPGCSTGTYMVMNLSTNIVGGEWWFIFLNLIRY